MRWKKNLYLVHRWLGLIVGLQLLAWSVGGFMFSLLDIDDVRGELDASDKDPPALRVQRVRLSPADAASVAAAFGVGVDSVAHIRLRERFERTVFEFFDPKGKPLGAVDAVSGEFIRRISEAEARDVALADFAPEALVSSIRLLEGDPPNEFRGGLMPVYQVILDHPKEPRLYISPVTGQVLKRRNNPWRLFDFFWMLHIMDYRNRDNFNHWLLTTMSVLAILTSSSGLALWWWRLPRFKRSAKRGSK